MPNLTSGFAQMWANRRAKAKPREIPEDRIISKVKLANGATYTRLKAAYADGTESVEDWKNWQL